jgi:hypothetical protein
MKELGCADCVVTVLLNIDSEKPANLSKNQSEAINNLASAGLVPPLRFAK